MTQKFEENVVKTSSVNFEYEAPPQLEPVLELEPSSPEQLPTPSLPWWYAFAFGSNSNRRPNNRPPARRPPRSPTFGVPRQSSGQEDYYLMMSALNGLLASSAEVRGRSVDGTLATRGGGPSTNNSREISAFEELRSALQITEAGASIKPGQATSSRPLPPHQRKPPHPSKRPMPGPRLPEPLANLPKPIPPPGKMKLDHQRPGRKVPSHLAALQSKPAGRRPGPEHHQPAPGAFIP